MDREVHARPSMHEPHSAAKHFVGVSEASRVLHHVHDHFM
jgi:hypothetical protein